MCDPLLRGHSQRQNTYICARRWESIARYPAAALCPRSHQLGSALGGCGLGAVDDVERLEDRGDVRLDGLFRNAEARADFLVGQLRAQVLEHVDLPIRQLCDGMRSGMPTAVGARRLRALGQQRRYVDTTAEH